jgi:hypothetical protein
MLAAAISLALVAAAQAPPSAALAACIAARDDFDASGMVASCQEAADEPGASTADRILALRTLAEGHVLEKNEPAAELAFTKMLLLDQSAAPAADAGPAILAVFERARTSFRARPVDEPAPPPPPAPVGAPAPAPPPTSWRGPLGFALVAVGGAAAVVGAGVGGWYGYHVFLDRVPCGDDGGTCFPECIDGVCGAARAKYVDDATTLVGVGVVTTCVGAALAGIGAAVLMTPDEAPQPASSSGTTRVP